MNSYLNYHPKRFLMQDEDKIVLDEFCISHQLEISFIRELEEYGLLEVITENQALFIPMHELPKLERMIRLHQELNINPEGLDAINHLLERIEALEKSIDEFRNRLSFYEENR